MLFQGGSLMSGAFCMIHGTGGRVSLALSVLYRSCTQFHNIGRFRS